MMALRCCLSRSSSWSIKVIWPRVILDLVQLKRLSAVQAQHQCHGVCWRFLRSIVLIKRFGLFVERMYQQCANAGVLR
jgi:hypothetical protein